MIYQLTPEQIQKNKSARWKVTGIGMVIVVGVLLIFTYPSFSNLDQNLPKILILWGITLLVALIAMASGMSQGRKKGVTQVQTKSKSFILTSELKEEEITGDSIGQLVISTNPSGNVALIFLKTLQQPYVFLKGYDQMDQLASDLEKIVSDPAKVVRNQARNSPSRKAWGTLMVIGMFGLILVFIGAFIWVLAKLGLGFLALPLSFVGMGVSRFIGNRRNRKERMTGVAFIFLGVLFAVFQFFTHYMGSGK